MKPTDFIAKNPVFTHEEFSAACGGSGSPRTVDSLLTYHSGVGNILRIRRGLFAAVPRGADAKKFQVDALLVASRCSADAVLAYSTALEFHVKAKVALKRYVYFTNTAPRPFTFRGLRFRAFSPPKALRDARKEAFGVETHSRSGLSVRVTSLERTIVDVIDRPVLSGGWEKAWRSLIDIEKVNLDSLVKYALFLGNATTTAALGIFLEQQREQLQVPDNIFKRLLHHLPAQPHYYGRGSKSRYRLIARWNLLAPERLLTRGWAVSAR